MSRSKICVEDHEENSDASFVSRWSRLKHENRQGADNASKNAALETDASDEAQAPPAKILTDEDMPDIASLVPDSDYTDFLSPGVSEALRKLALQKLFHSEVFNIRDGLDDYDGDYTHFEKLGGIVTSDMHHQIEMEAQRKARQLLLDEEPCPDDAGTSVTCVDNNGKESACENMITTVDQGMSTTQLDQLPMEQVKTLTESETDNHTEIEMIVEENVTQKGESKS